MPEKKKQKKNGSQELTDKVDAIYDILAAHKMDLESLESQMEKLSGVVGKVSGRMGL
jgi:ribose 5-phosphate isomerase